MREWTNAHVLRGPLRPFASRAYRALIAAEVAAARLVPHTDEPIDRASVTALIKTFERPGSSARLVASLQRLYPHLPIILVDDSRHPVPILGTSSVILPFDSGVGVGRQAGLDRVTTPFVLNLDDDFMAYGGTGLGRALATLADHPQLDIVGGRVIDLPFLTSQKYRNAGMLPTTATSLIAPGTRVGKVEILDKVANFFLARTASLRAIGWDARLKRLDHADFFTRAKGRIVSGMLDDFRIVHVRDPFDRAYRVHRFDLEADLDHLVATYGDGSAPSE